MKSVIPHIKPDSTNKNQTESREFELFGKIHLPIFEQRATALLGGCKLKLKFIPNDPTFFIKTALPVRLKSIEYTDCSLRVKGIKVFKHIVDAHNLGLLYGNARYKFLENFVVPVTINKGIQDIILDNLHSGTVPNRVLVTFVDHRAFNGSFIMNPYNFQNFGVNHLSLYINGNPAGGPSKNPNFTNGWYAREYYDLFEVTNQDNIDTCVTITKENFIKGNNIFCFRCQPDLYAGGNVGLVNPTKLGALRLHLRFDKALENTITALVYMDFDAVLEIKSERNAVYDFI